jgi:voltage-gated potassium channel
VEKQIQALTDHYIICGLGRMGRTICQHLRERGKPFVVVDKNESKVEQFCNRENWPYIVGDATDDGILFRAGVHRARALSAVLTTDADNVYVVLTARLLAPALQIVARASEEKAIAKMVQAGANRVVSPYSTGATKIARFMLNPNIEDFFEIADRTGKELELADYQLAPESPLVGKKLSETQLRDRGVIIVGIRRADGELLIPPPASSVLHASDCLFVFGSAEALNDSLGIGR